MGQRTQDSETNRHLIGIGLIVPAENAIGLRNVELCVFNAFFSWCEVQGIFHEDPVPKFGCSVRITRSSGISMPTNQRLLVSFATCHRRAARALSPPVFRTKIGFVRSLRLE
jgi:hypothetical protein